MDNPYSYYLPPELLAHTAANPRDSAKILLWPRQEIGVFSNLANYLNAGDVLVINTSKVIPARLFGQRPPRQNGAQPVDVELLLHRHLAPDFTRWQAFARPGRRLNVGDEIHLPDGAKAIVEAKGGDGGQCEITLHTHGPVPVFLEQHGHTPLPPYIKAEDSQTVRERYQTVYADPKKPGSVAAPTAGLHFTPQVFEALKAKGIQVVTVTLHVGAGTFLNPTPEQIAQKKLHAEWAEISAETAQAILAAKARGNAVIPVGTTGLRTLESWAMYGNLNPQGWCGETTIFIQPGYKFQTATRLITNFHLPESSLLMLVSAFIGVENMQQLYAHAIQNRLRFFSFGDSSLLTRHDQ